MEDKSRNSGYLEAIAQEAEWCFSSKQQTLEKWDASDCEASKRSNDWKVDDLRAHHSHHHPQHDVKSMLLKPDNCQAHDHAPLYRAGASCAGVVQNQRTLLKIRQHWKRNMNHSFYRHPTCDHGTLPHHLAAPVHSPQIFRL